MMLSDVNQAGQCRVLSAATDHPELQSRLYSLGLYPGVVVDVLRFAPMGDPIQVRAGGTLISIRKQDARLIAVETLS